MDFLKPIFDDKALTYDQFAEKLAAAKDIKLANLAGGGYVVREKLTAKEAEIEDLKKQLAQREADVSALKKLDAEGLQAKLSELQSQYEADRQAWEKKDQQRQYEDRRREFFSGVEFTDEYAKRGVLAEFDERQFQYSDADSTFVGAKEWLGKLQETSPTAFKGSTPTPKAVGSTTGIAPKADFNSMTYSQMVAYQEAHPGAKID